MENNARPACSGVAIACNALCRYLELFQSCERVRSACWFLVNLLADFLEDQRLLNQCPRNQCLLNQRPRNQSPWDQSLYNQSLLTAEYRCILKILFIGRILRNRSLGELLHPSAIHLPTACSMVVTRARSCLELLIRSLLVIRWLLALMLFFICRVTLRLFI